MFPGHSRAAREPQTPSVIHPVVIASTPQEYDRPSHRKELLKEHSLFRRTDKYSKVSVSWVRRQGIQKRLQAALIVGEQVPLMVQAIVETGVASKYSENKKPKAWRFSYEYPSSTLNPWKNQWRPSLNNDKTARIPKTPTATSISIKVKALSFMRIKINTMNNYNLFQIINRKIFDSEYFPFFNY
jgi:hypothetical protein